MLFSLSWIEKQYATFSNFGRASLDNHAQLPPQALEIQIAPWSEGFRDLLRQLSSVP